MNNIESFFNDLFYDPSTANLSYELPEILCSYMFYPIGYPESDRARILNKLYILRDSIQDINVAHYKFVMICIQKVDSGYGLTDICINYLNKIHELHHQ